MRKRVTQRRITRHLTPKVVVDGEMVKKERTVEVDTDAAEADGLIARLAVTYAQTVRHYMSAIEADDSKAYPEKLKWANEHAEDYAKFRADEAREKPAREVEWSHLAALSAKDTPAALELWGRVCDAAYDDLVSGLSAADVVGQSSPFHRAQFLALREHFTEGWNPQNGIERTLIDMLAQEYTLYLHWTKISHERGNNIVENQSNWRREAQTAGWLPPSQDIADAVVDGYKLADGYHRQFMRTLRQLRDMRRYKLIIQNPGQVNISNQQVNVSQ